jgi:hypothetical protein
MDTKSNTGAQIATGLNFGQALCAHFGLSAGKVLAVKVNDGRDELFGATVTIALTPNDVEAIGRLMADPTTR